MSKPIEINLSPLHLPLRTNFKQASSSRSVGESIWATGRRGEHIGYGEGCPRIYVTGETVASGLEWLDGKLSVIERECRELDSLRSWVKENETAIDRHPAAWCAIETALLDLFAREQMQSVEKMLGLSDPLMKYQYTAVLSDGPPEKYEALIQRYLKWGFSDFKIKLSGNLQQDQAKLETLTQIFQSRGMTDFRARLDANNLWADKTDQAIEFLSLLPASFFGIEEPVEPKNPRALQAISQALNTAVILDESLGNLADLRAYDDLVGNFIANIKVSRVGGVLRGLNLMEALKERGWRIIMGAHVGETSVMTRAGMCLAQAAGEHLIAQEGAFGTILLESEPVVPSLMFGVRGQLDLRHAYVLKTEAGPRIYQSDHWKMGWGLDGSD